VAAGSFNGDRRRDLAVARVGYQSGTLIHIFHQDAYGLLQPATPLEATPQPVGLLAVDLDRDTLDDLLVLGGASWSVGYYQNRYGRGLGGQVRYQVSPPDEEDANALVAVDVNQDGHLDVVQAGSGGLDFLHGTGRRWGTAVHGSQPLLPGGSAVRGAVPQPLATALSLLPTFPVTWNVEQAPRGIWVASLDARRLQSLPQRLAWVARATSAVRGWIARLSGWWNAWVSSDSDATTTASDAPKVRSPIAMEAEVARRASSPSTTPRTAASRIAFAPTFAGPRICDRFR